MTIMYFQEKITHKIARLTKLAFSVECVPPSTQSPLYNNAIELVNQVSKQVLFVGITWHQKYNPPSCNVSASIQLAKSILSSIQPSPPEILMHLACMGQTKESIKCILDQLIQLGIRNLLIVRGDYDANITSPTGDFEFASQLLSFIRSCHGDYFCIGVPGYPNKNTCQDWQCLEEKVALGADFIITQLFFQSQSFIQFVNKCKERGIHLPILPGIMPIHSIKTVKLISRLIESPIPEDVIYQLKNISHEDEEEIFNFASNQIVDLCTPLINETKVIHLFCLNKKKSTVLILQKLGLI